jgi:hypothetical protein
MQSPDWRLRIEVNVHSTASTKERRSKEEQDRRRGSGQEEKKVNMHDTAQMNAIETRGSLGILTNQRLHSSISMSAEGLTEKRRGSLFPLEGANASTMRRSSTAMRSNANSTAK